MSSLRVILVSLRNIKLNCKSFQACHHSPLMTSCQVLMASKRKNMKRKFNRPIVHKPKGLNMTGKVIEINENMTVAQLALSMDKDIDHVYEVMMYIDNTEMYDSSNKEIRDFNVLKEIVRKSGMRFRLRDLKSVQEVVDKDVRVESRGPLRKRPPVVTIMGHVDHGKTTLLDCLHKTNIVHEEFGGITQHIGAFTVKLATSDDHITFLDTPGHAAFSAMRGRGATVTDVVVLVVAVDDGVMQQTIECIGHAKSSKVPLIVALNKADKAPEKIDQVKRELLQHGVQLEDFGGDIQAIEISALKGTNIDKLEEAIIALSEISEIASDYSGQIDGHIIEATYSPGRGKLATVLIQNGTLRKGDILTAGLAWCKVRSMFSDDGCPVLKAEPGRAVEVIGWRELPAAGDRVLSVESEQRAKEAIEFRQSLKKEIHMAMSHEKGQEKADIHDLEYKTRRQDQLDKGYRRSSIYRKERLPESTSCEKPKLPIVLKGDVGGSVEVILDALDTYDCDDQCQLTVLHYGVGDVNPQDVEIASHFDGIVYAFNVGVPSGVKEKASLAGVPLLSFNVIYRFIDSLKQQLTARLRPVEETVVIGEANVQQTFVVSNGKKKLQVAGCRCSKGQLVKKQRYMVLRKGEVVHDGLLTSLKHFKNEVDTIKLDVECGLCFESKSVSLEKGDLIRCYSVESVKQKLRWEPEHF